MLTYKHKGLTTSPNGQSLGPIFNHFIIQLGLRKGNNSVNVEF